MSQTPPVNTLVQYPYYKGHDPRKWKFIGKWDSQYWMKDLYETQIGNTTYLQYDLICGQGIVVIDQLNTSETPSYYVVNQD